MLAMYSCVWHSVIQNFILCQLFSFTAVFYSNIEQLLKLCHYPTHLPGSSSMAPVVGELSCPDAAPAFFTLLGMYFTQNPELHSPRVEEGLQVTVGL
jgi:hypothetical protein